MKVEYIGHVKNILNTGREEEVELREGSSVQDLLLALAEKFGTPFKKAIYEQSGADVKANFMVTVNGYLLNQLKGVDTKLKEGDRVALLPVVSGG